MLSAFLFLLLFTAHLELHADQQATDQMPGGNISTPQQQESSDGQKGNHTTGVKPATRLKKHCSFQALLKHLNLTKTNELYTLSRPVKYYKQPTLVHLQMVLYAILDVRETDQTFIPYVWIYMGWPNDHIEWNPEEFCGLNRIVIPAELLWKPDLTIEETTEKDKAPPSPYLTVNSEGYVELRNDQVLISTCRMQVYKFPFDTQMCNLSFKSVVHSYEEVRFSAKTNTSKITGWSREVMGKQYEWLLLNVTVDKQIENKVNNFGYDQSVIVYTISMRRKSALYIINFILPILFLLCLDFASFLISDSGGEKLGFKITVLLAVTVMQLILNEILPSSSERIPLIAVYCTGIFALMLLSLLETIVVMYLLDKEATAQHSEADKDQGLNEDCVESQATSNFHCCFREKKKCTCCKRARGAGEMPAEELPNKESSSSQLMEVSHALEKFSDELREIEKTMTVIRSSTGKEEKKPSYWTTVTKKINKIFLICYITAVVLFLVFIFSLWIIAEDN